MSVSLELFQIHLEFEVFLQQELKRVYYVFVSLECIFDLFTNDLISEIEIIVEIIVA